MNGFAVKKWARRMLLPNEYLVIQLLLLILFAFATSFCGGWRTLNSHFPSLTGSYGWHCDGVTSGKLEGEGGKLVRNILLYNNREECLSLTNTLQFCIFSINEACYHEVRSQRQNGGGVYVLDSINYSSCLIEKTILRENKLSLFKVIVSWVSVNWSQAKPNW